MPEIGIFEMPEIGIFEMPEIGLSRGESHLSVCVSGIAATSFSSVDMSICGSVDLSM